MGQSYQRGCVVKSPRKSGDVWVFRFREGKIQRSELIGTVRQYPLKSHAEKAAGRFRKHLNTKIEVITVGDLIDRFEREAMPDRETTASSYRSIFKRIREQWGEMRLDRFSDSMVAVEQWLKELRVVGRHPRPGAKPFVSNLYRAQVKNLLHLLMEKAMLWNSLAMQRNPIDAIRLKNAGGRAKELVILTPAQYAELLDDPELPEVTKVLIQVLAGLGLRISEALGLQWNDCDFEAKTIEIRRSVVNGKANDTKTIGSAVKLPLHDNLIAVLKEWKTKEKFKSPWVFCSERTGMPLTRDSMRDEHLQPAGERIGIVGLGWHSFRHFYRNLLRRLDTPIEVQKNLMRHAKLATTMDIYGGKDDTERLRPANERVIELLRRRA